MSLEIVLYTHGLPFDGGTLERQALGGSESACIYLGRALARQGHRVTVFCPCPRPGRYHGVDYHDLSAFEAWRAGPGCDLFICARFFQAFLRPVPAAATVLWSHDHFGPEQFAALRRLLPRIGILYCLSDYHCDFFLEHLPEASARLRKTCNGLDLALIDELAADTAKAHKIMFTSRPERGLPQALDLYERLDDPRLELVVCTYEYPWKEGGIAEIEAACQARIAHLRRRGFPVTAGQFDKRTLYRHLAASKAVLHPTAVPEICCLSALEALACRCVYLAPEHSSFREIIPYARHDLRGAGPWLAALEAVLDDDAHRAALAEQGYQHVREHTWDRIARQFVEEAAEPATTDLAGDPAPGPSLQPRPALPKISCLTVTLDRLILLKEAIRCYVDQTYPNKELVIVTEGTPRYRRAIASYLEALDRDDIRLVALDGAGNYTLGRVRNAALDAATGDVVCQWDDDDLYHPERLRIQAEHMLRAGAAACFMADQLQYFDREHVLFWVDWTDGGRIRGWPSPGTLMMYADARFRYPDDVHEGEDSALQQAIAGRLPIAELSGQGHLYVYRYHGRNIWSQEHHRKLTADHAAPAELIQERAEPLLAALRYYPLPRPYTVKARGGQVLFSYNG